MPGDPRSEACGHVRRGRVGQDVERRATLDAQAGAAVVVRRRADECQVERRRRAEPVARVVRHDGVLDTAALGAVDEDAVAALAAVDRHAEHDGVRRVPDRDPFTFRRVDDGVRDRGVRGPLDEDALAAARAFDDRSAHRGAAAVRDANAEAVVAEMQILEHRVLGARQPHAGVRVHDAQRA